jgi:predicted ATPase/DNA-binding winged helix-turn-helix (wHTH) protein
MGVELDSRAGEVLSFGPFHLTPSERLLARGTEPVAVGGRALDILIALIEQAGEVVSRRSLMARVWPDVTVEEANLRVHLASLRKCLGDGLDGARYIANVPGRGYCFVAPVQRSSASRPAAPAELVRAVRQQKLPSRLQRMVGRNDTVATLSSLLRSRRFVSIVGPGGMGKTTVAVAVAHALVSEFEDGICFVDLGAHTDAAHVATAVTSALGCFGQAQDPLPGLLAFLADKPILLVLDNCEHLVEPVAALAERLFVEAPRVHLLTTSREALRVEGETVHLLMPLESPLDGEISAAQALASPAVQLFMERAVAGGHRFELSDADAPVVAMICRRLDGIALAIELAAGRVGTYGIRGTADLLDNRFKLLWQGRRSALPRHQTLQAMLDWSFHLLSDVEQTTLRRLSTFVGPFTLGDAIAVAGVSAADASDVAHAVAGLINKSLVWTSDSSGSTYHRLLDTTRTYAASKLAESGEENGTARRHALHFAYLVRADEVRTTAFGSLTITAYAPRMGNLRAALEWCFGIGGDAQVGIELAAGAAPLFLGFSLLGECEHWCERGLAALQEADRGTRLELALQEALAISSMFTRGNSDAVRSAIERGLGLAEALGDRQYQLNLLAGLNIFLTRIGDFRAALDYAERSVSVVADGDEHSERVMADWMLGVSHHLVGNQEAAQRHCERGLALEAASGRVYVNFFGYDHRVRALVALARALWLRGRPVRALEVAHQAIEEAARGDHPVTVCISLIYAIPVFFWTGDFESAAERIEQLIAHATKYSLAPYRAVGVALKGELAVLRGDAYAGVALLRGASAALEAERHNILATVFSRALAEGLAQCGQLDEAVAMITGAVKLAEDRGAGFDLPDLLRARAEILLAGPHPNVAAAEAAFLRSIECARKQSALGWELRTAIPLAELWVEQGAVERARDMLNKLCPRFAEGLETADLGAAARLLSRLGPALAVPPAL